MKVINLTRNISVSDAAKTADTVSTRLFGLIPRRGMGEQEALWLSPCAMIHTCFMRFAIDAVFLDQELKVAAIFENLKPWRFSPWVRRAHSVLELPAGRSRGRVFAGDRLAFLP
jgi:uncharacterized membrane protein (UPF0127 family)